MRAGRLLLRCFGELLLSSATLQLRQGFDCGYHHDRIERTYTYMDEIDQIFKDLRRSIRGSDTVAIDTAELRVKQLLLRHSVNEPLVKTRRSRGDA